MTTRDAAHLARLGTEQAGSEFSDLDRLPVPQLVQLLTAQARRAGDAVAEASGQIAPVVEAVVKRLAIGGRLIYVGAGTAGRIGTLDAAEAAPTFSVPDGTIAAVLAGGQQAFGRSVENVEDDPAAGADALDRLGISERDAVLGISASGRTPFVLGAMRRANELGAATACLACNEGTPLGELAQFPIEIRVGPEVIAGSTRMNAGTVQKIVLNTISTAAMVRLGKTYGSLMVDVRPTNTKLRERAVRIVTEITGVPSREARRALLASGWRPKVASIVAAYRLDPDEATALLEKYGGRLRDALNAAGRTPRVLPPQK
ncbi:MAG TPA: N-acetylmuramic acid 6-phosphate etherase [Streptosporangiaceae bacterium]